MSTKPGSEKLAKKDRIEWALLVAFHGNTETMPATVPSTISMASIKRALKAGYGVLDGNKIHVSPEGLRVAKEAPEKTAPEVTHLNLFALVEYVIAQGGATMSARVPVGDAPHLKRCIPSLVVPYGKGQLRLTAEGRKVVGDDLVRKLEKELAWQYRPSGYPGVTPQGEAAARERETTKHVQRLAALERAVDSVSKTPAAT